MKTTKVLMDEHKHILRALNVLEQMAECAERGETVGNRDVEDILRFLKMFADDHHQGKEESVLFPAMLKASQPVQVAALNQMIFEHDQERSLVEGLEDALRTNQGSEFVYFAERLIHILRTHIYKEDHVLFELADSILSEEQDAQAARELDKYNLAWKEKALDGLLERLQRLEWKYLARTTRDRKRYA
jgi:hemerythrin-like domain-containing protein